MLHTMSSALRRAWERRRLNRYRRHLSREAVEEQDFKDREERHRAGIFEPPHGGL